MLFPVSIFTKLTTDQLLTDISGQPTGPETSLRNCHHTLRIYPRRAKISKPKSEIMKNWSGMSAHVLNYTISAGEWPQAARLLRSWVRIPPGAWIFVCCECRVLSSKGLCDEPITRPEESYRLWCVVVCDLETSRMVAPYIYDISSLKV